MELGGGFVLCVVLLAALVGRATAATYVVGDNLGWTVPSSVNEYSSWASRHVFRPGDVLTFNFVTGEHDVAEVRKAAYDECSSNDPIVLSTVGPWNTTLNSTGEHYYICTFGRHCSLGQKLAINVTAPSPTPPPSPPMPPASSPPSPTPMSGSPSPIPPPTQMPRSPSPTPSPTPMPGSPTPMSGSPTPMSGSPSSNPSPAPMPGSPTPMSGSPSSNPSPAPMPGSPGGSPSPGTPGGTPTTSPPPGNSATLPTVSATLVVLASVAFGLIM